MVLAIYGPAKNGANAIFRPQQVDGAIASAARSQRVVFGPWQAASGNVIFGLYARAAGGYPTGRKKKSSKAVIARSTKQEVTALAAAITKSAKLTKTVKKQRRDEVEAEVIKLLDDVPNVEQVAPIIAQAVVRREAQIAALPPGEVTAGEQRADTAAIISQQIAKWRAKVRYDSHVDDDSEIEMLLLG